MSEEPKPCPFCDVVGAHYAHQHKEGCYFWLLDRGSRTETRVPVYLLRNAWNTRPGENALQTRAEEAEAEIERLQERAPEWISVEDDLPKDRKRVMVVVWPDTIKIGYHVKGFRQWATDDDIYYHDDLYNYITHWKPLPAPPESEEEMSEKLPPVERSTVWSGTNFRSKTVKM